MIPSRLDPTARTSWLLASTTPSSKVQVGHLLLASLQKLDPDRSSEMSYCGDYLEDYGIVYLQGPGRMANMDIDCDGEQGGPEDDGRCDDTGTTIPETSVRGVIEGYDVGISDLNPHVHSFAVFGNSGDQDEWATFDPRSVGIEKASLMAVVCGNQMVSPPQLIPLQMIDKTTS